MVFRMDSGNASCLVSFGVITALALEHVESGKAGQEDI